MLKRIWVRESKGNTVMTYLRQHQTVICRGLLVLAAVWCLWYARPMDVYSLIPVRADAPAPHHFFQQILGFLTKPGHVSEPIRIPALFLLMALLRFWALPPVPALFRLGGIRRSRPG